MTLESPKPVVHYYYRSNGASARNAMQQAVAEEMRAANCIEYDNYYTLAGSEKVLCCLPDNVKPTHRFAIVELTHGQVPSDSLRAILRNSQYKQIWVLANRSIADFYPDEASEMRACCDTHDYFQEMVVRSST